MERRDAINRARAARERITHARDSGSRRELAAALRSYTRNAAVKFDIAYSALGPTFDAERAERLVSEMDLFQPDTSPIYYWRTPKRSGGFREICRMTLTGSLRQKILKSAIEASFSPGPHLFLIRRRGRILEAHLILEALNAGYQFGVIADIRSAFRAVNTLEALRNTQLPSTVIRNNLYYENRHFIHDPSKEGTHTQQLHGDISGHLEGPRGLIQGAASSSIIFALLLNDLPHALLGDVQLFVYGDDILLVARRQEECAAAVATLERYMTAHPSGPFQLNFSPACAALGFERVGHGYHWDRQTQRIEVTPDSRGMDSLRTRLSTLIALNARLRMAPKAGAVVATRRFARHYAVTNLPALVQSALAWVDGEATAMTVATDQA